MEKHTPIGRYRKRERGEALHWFLFILTEFPITNMLNSSHHSKESLLAENNDVLRKLMRVLERNSIPISEWWRERMRKDRWRKQFFLIYLWSNSSHRYLNYPNSELTLRHTTWQFPSLDALLMQMEVLLCGLPRPDSPQITFHPETIDSHSGGKNCLHFAQSSLRNKLCLTKILQIPPSSQLSRFVRRSFRVHSILLQSKNRSTMVQIRQDDQTGETFSIFFSIETLLTMKIYSHFWGVHCDSSLWSQLHS